MAEEVVKTLAVRSSKHQRACARAPNQQSNAPAIECIGRDRAHASSAHKVRIALAAIANLLRRGIPKRLRAINRIPCDRVQPMRSSAPDLAAKLILFIDRILS